MSDNNSLIIPDKSQIPAFLLNKQLAANFMDEAAAGIGAGMPPRIKLSAKQFKLVDSNGEETAFPPSQMFASDDGFYMPAIILRAKRAFSKVWYLEAYNPNNEEVKAPDCFSLDALRPDPSSSSPQCETCAACPMNAFGSGKDQNGTASKGKACTDNKILAVYAAGAVYQLKIPPASLKNYRLYLDQVRVNLPDVPLYAIKTLIGFDAQSDFSVLVFRFGGFVGADKPEQQQKIVELLAQKAMSTEAEAIIGNNGAPLALPTPAEKKAIEAPAGPSPEELAAKAEAEAKAAADAKTKADAAAAKKAAKARADAEAKAAKEAAEKAAAAAASAPASSGDVSDDLLRAELGLI